MMVVAKYGPAQTVKAGWKSVEEVSEFCYFASVIVNEGSCDQDIKTRFGKADATFGRLNKIW